MKGIALLLVSSLVLAACARHAPQTPLPAGQWAYHYDSGDMAYYDGHGWSYGVNHCAQAPQAPRSPRFAAATPSVYSWVGPLTGASYGLMATGTGVVYNAHCTVKAIAASETLYVFFIDTGSASQPTNGTAAINGGVSGGMSAAGNDVTWSDQTYPALSFINGIMVAASTTPDTYTAPNAADVLRCDIKLRANNP